MRNLVHFKLLLAQHLGSHVLRTLLSNSFQEHAVGICASCADGEAEKKILYNIMPWWNDLIGYSGINDCWGWAGAARRCLVTSGVFCALWTALQPGIRQLTLLLGGCCSLQLASSSDLNSFKQELSHLKNESAEEIPCSSEFFLLRRKQYTNISTMSTSSV